MMMAYTKLDTNTPSVSCMARSARKFVRRRGPYWPAAFTEAATITEKTTAPVPMVLPAIRLIRSLIASASGAGGKPTASASAGPHSAGSARTMTATIRAPVAMQPGTKP